MPQFIELTSVTGTKILVNTSLVSEISRYGDGGNMALRVGENQLVVKETFDELKIALDDLVSNS